MMDRPGFVFDTGMLVALERRKQRANHFLTLAQRDRIPIRVPAPVYSEWWRGRTDQRETLRRTFDLESPSEPVLRLAGEALAQVKGKFEACIVIDALVIACAAVRGDAVLTGDVDDFARLSRFFPNVRILGCGS